MKSLILTLTLIAATSITAFSQQHNTAHLNLEDGIAIKGYDPVSYFTSDEPLEGKENLTFEYEGATYQFATQQNLDTFKADPAKYAPAYGGWCAYAVGNGYTADVDPETYKILNGKLLLFYNKFLVNTLNRWNKDEANLSKSAEQNWPTVKAELENN